MADDAASIWTRTSSRNSSASSSYFSCHSRIDFDEQKAGPKGDGAGALIENSPWWLQTHSVSSWTEQCDHFSLHGVSLIAGGNQIANQSFRMDDSGRSKAIGSGSSQGERHNFEQKIANAGRASGRPKRQVDGFRPLTFIFRGVGSHNDKLIPSYKWASRMDFSAKKSAELPLLSEEQAEARCCASSWF
ncbi:hypothetical protein AC579_7502 [Pseudocercospora musae]|uniref:Uncharacterized protein n=1 Tax=Pseudocercospora musae TaxID=113226 RepID=A0A139IBS1_9PEZI|nr:hypothetical protein AC579_7502 [Pseudocercospora musae]